VDAQSLIYMLETAQFETREEWEKFYDEAHRIFDSLSQEEQEIVIEDNAFEPLSMILEAYHISDEEV